ncbi:MAG: hypothetical protein JNL69_07780 [Bacteroidia bacterium]|nr:hypothetical protein [Bacteroidia bacterium]
MQENGILYNSLTEDVSDYTLSNLIAFIREDFHSYFIENLSLINTLMHSCVVVDTQEVPNLPAVYQKFTDFKDLLEQHTGEEEFIVFPIVADLLKHKGVESIPSQTVSRVIDDIESKHNSLHEKLNSLEKESNFFEDHTGVSPTLKHVYSLLIKLKHNFTVYSFIENNYLYPKLNHLIKQLN